MLEAVAIMKASFGKLGHSQPHAVSTCAVAHEVAKSVT